MTSSRIFDSARVISFFLKSPEEDDNVSEAETEILDENMADAEEVEVKEEQ